MTPAFVAAPFSRQPGPVALRPAPPLGPLTAPPSPPARRAARTPALTLTPSRTRPARSATRSRAVAANPYPAPPPDPSQRVSVEIYAPASNRRVIAASNLIHAPLPIVWALLSDYGRLADHIPNLLVSKVRPHPAPGGIRLEQCGSQSILGFTFRAALVMDMTEVDPASDDGRAIEFKLVNSQDFREFSGVWRLERLTDTKTALYYTVEIVPKGMVPVRAIEWRISEDVPGNMDAVRTECERRRRAAVAQRRATSTARTEQQQPPTDRA